MVRFSCFQTPLPSHRQKKTVQLSSEAIRKSLEDSSQNKGLSGISCLKSDNSGLKGEGGTENKIADCMLDYSLTERDCKSDEVDTKYSSDCDTELHKTSVIKKSQSLGSVLNWEERTFGADGSGDDMEQRFSYDGSTNRSGIAVADGIDLNVLTLLDQRQDPMLSDSVQVGSDFTKNVSIFSIGDPQLIEKEFADKDDIGSSVMVGSGNASPHIRPVIAKSNSLPRIGSPVQCFASLLPHSKSAEDLSSFSSRKASVVHEVGRQIQFEERDTSVFQYDKNNVENPADEADENYNYVGSAKDWIVPVSDGANMEKDMGGDASYSYWGEVPNKNFKLKRIEQWVTNLQYSAPLEESDECDPSYDQQELSKGNTLLEDPTAGKLNVKATPGMEAAKRYISTLNPSATVAHLTNLGLVLIPFLSAFVSLKALNLSGNAIVRIAAGALPRGLHILNLSRNNISAIEGLRDLTRLRVLDLSYNRILRIGHGLAGCSSLKELYLAGNKISEVEGLHRLLKLNVLDLRFNKISTAKCLGQLAANYNCLHALSLEGNPAQKNVGDEPLKKYVLSLLPNLTYYNRQSIKVGTMKDGADRSARLGIGSHQIERGLRVEMKNMRKGTHTHGIVAQKGSSSSSHGHGHGHGRKGQTAPSAKAIASRHSRRPPSGMRTAAVEHQLSGLRNDFSVHRSRSEGNLEIL